MEGPFTKSRKIILNGVVPIQNGTRQFGVYNGNSGNNEPYELTFENLHFPNLKSGQATIVLNRNGVELWKVKLAGTERPESLQISYNGTVYEANWKLERSTKNLKFLLKLTNDHRFLEFVSDLSAQSGNFNLKSNFIVEVVEAVSRFLFEN